MLCNVSWLYCFKMRFTIHAAYCLSVVSVQLFFNIHNVVTFRQKNIKLINIDCVSVFVYKYKCCFVWFYQSKYRICMFVCICICICICVYEHLILKYICNLFTLKLAHFCFSAFRFWQGEKIPICLTAYFPSLSFILVICHNLYTSFCSSFSFVNGKEKDRTENRTHRFFGSDKPATRLHLYHHQRAYHIATAHCWHVEKKTEY